MSGAAVRQAPASTRLPVPQAAGHYRKAPSALRAAGRMPRTNGPSRPRAAAVFFGARTGRTDMRFAVFTATLARISALTAVAGMASSTRKSIAWRVAVEAGVEQPGGSATEAPLANVSITAFLQASPVQMMPSRHQAGTHHVHSSATCGSACRSSGRMPSPSSSSRASTIARSAGGTHRREIAKNFDSAVRSERVYYAGPDRGRAREHPAMQRIRKARDGARRALPQKAQSRRAARVRWDSEVSQ